MESPARPAARRHVPLRHLLRPLADPIRREWPKLVAGVMCGWGKFLLPLIIPWITGRVFDDVLTGLEGETANRRLYGYLGLALITVIALGIATYFRHAIATSLAARIQHHLRRHLFHHIQRLSMRFFATHHSGSLGSRVSNDITYAGLIVEKGIIQLAMDAVCFLVIAGFMLAMNWPLAVLTFLLSVSIGVGLQRYRPRMRDQRKNIQEGRSSITGTAAEYFSAISVVKAFAGEHASGAAFDRSSRHVRDLEEENSRLQGRYHSLSFALLLATQCSVVFVGAWFIINRPESLSAGQLVAFLMLVSYLNGNIQRLIDNLLQLEDSLAALERIHDILVLSPSPDDKPDAITPPLDGTIDLHRVSFAYEETTVLHAIDYRFQAGRSYALVGASGSGKSTLCQLLLRFYDPIDGTIVIDGHDLRDVRQAHYRAHVAVVLQDPIIFSGSVAENIGFAVPDADQQHVEKAARMAQAHEFITQLPHGYDTSLGERGVSLSGGQRQRIAIARALMRDPRILILDEATSALDTVTERSIQEVIEKLQGSRTMVVIAHRLSTIRNVDEILVLEDGHLIEAGSYADLVAAGGAFARLAAQQELAA